MLIIVGADLSGIFTNATIYYSESVYNITPFGCGLVAWKQ